MCINNTFKKHVNSIWLHKRLSKSKINIKIFTFFQNAYANMKDNYTPVKKTDNMFIFKKCYYMQEVISSSVLVGLEAE